MPSAVRPQYEVLKDNYNFIVINNIVQIKASDTYFVISQKFIILDDNERILLITPTTQTCRLINVD